MRAVRGLGLAIGFAIIPLLSGCLDSREEIWIETSGCGRAEMLYQFPASVMVLHGGLEGVRGMCSDFLAASPGLRQSTCDVSVLDDRASLRVGFAFDSAKDLVELANGPAMDSLPGAAKHWLGELTASIKGRDVEFRRVMELSKAAPGIGFIPKSQLADHKLETIVHLPVAPHFHNAHGTEADGTVLKWSVPISEAAKRAVVQEFRATWPLPGWFPALAAIPVLLIGLVILRRGIMRRNGASLGSPVRR